MKDCKLLQIKWTREEKGTENGTTQLDKKTSVSQRQLTGEPGPGGMRGRGVETDHITGGMSPQAFGLRSVDELTETNVCNSSWWRGYFTIASWMPRGEMGAKYGT